MRFAVAREQGLTEDQVAHIGDGYDRSPLTARDVAALRLTDSLICSAQSVPAEVQVELRRHFSDAQIVELALGVGLFHALSKVLIVLGLEPAQMPTSVLPTPDLPD